MMKSRPPIAIEGARLLVDYLPRYADELPAYLHFLAACAKHANIETQRSEQIHAADFRDERKREFREMLKRVEVG